MQIIAPLPDRDFDVTESAVTWKILTQGGVKVHFCTENGHVANCDPLLINGLPFGLGAEEYAIRLYEEMAACQEFQNPFKWEEVDFMSYHGVLLVGGHAQGMKQYLESKVLQEKLAEYFPETLAGGRKVLGAICHGTVLLSRVIDPLTGIPVLSNRKTTTLPFYLERAGYFLTFWKLGMYFRTYEKYVEDEVRECLSNPENLLLGPCNWFGDRKSPEKAFVCVDENYVSARWPGDTPIFAKTFLEILNKVNHS